MVFWVLLAISFCCLYVALRAHSWPFALVACQLVVPISLVSFAGYFYFSWWACVLLALALGLRWSVTPLAWLGLFLTATAICWVAYTTPYYLGWPGEIYWILPFSVLIGIFSLVVPEPPWNRSVAWRLRYQAASNAPASTNPAPSQTIGAGRSRESRMPMRTEDSRRVETRPAGARRKA